MDQKPLQRHIGLRKRTGRRFFAGQVPQHSSKLFQKSFPSLQQHQPKYSTKKCGTAKCLRTIEGMIKTKQAAIQKLLSKKYNCYTLENNRFFVAANKIKSHEKN